MRGDSEAHEMVAPGSLAAVLELMAEAPGRWTPIAGGTELMVAHSAGRLAASKFISLWDIPDLRFIHSMPDTLVVGAGVTFTDMRTNAVIASDFPLLARAATWIGSIANQNRATLGGNLVNGSPAADSSPALLVYDADVELVSVRGRRCVAYRAFHTGYKKNVLGPDELVLAIHLPRRFESHRQYIRKVGTRRAMAVAKVALAGTALLEGAIVREIWLGTASLAAFPARLYRTEDAICGKQVDAESIGAARAALLTEVLPIDDIRSTADYRRSVAANLLGEFLNTLRASETYR